MWSFKKPKISPSHGEVSCGEKREAKPNIYIKCLFLEDCVVWCLGGHSPPPGQPYRWKQKAGGREAGCGSPHPCAPQPRVCSAFKVGHQCGFCPQPALRTPVTSVVPGPWAPPGPIHTRQHAYALSVSENHCGARLLLASSKRDFSHLLTSGS